MSTPDRPTLDYAGPPKSGPSARGETTVRIVICSIIAMLGGVIMACSKFSEFMSLDWFIVGFLVMLIGVCLLIELVHGWRGRDK
jgi:hypothetical protein